MVKLGANGHGMAIAMEVASWRGSELGTSPRKKRAWGADAQQLMQLMMGQLQTQQQPATASPDVRPAAVPAAELTLDLFGRTADPSATGVVPQLSSSLEFLHLDPEDSEPLPSGWEKCLDLQVGTHLSQKLYKLSPSSKLNEKFLSNANLQALEFSKMSVLVQLSVLLRLYQ